MEKILIILRGLPGSGKTSIASLLSDKICCADDFYMVNGKYVYDTSKETEAHEWCQLKCRLMMAAGHERIVVANTNTTESEMLPYIEFAKVFRYKVFYLIVENRHDGKSSHSVPDDVMELMKNRFEVKL